MMRRWGAYFVCGFTGYLLGLALMIALAQHAGLDTSARLAVALTPPMSFLLLVKGAAIVTGFERIVFYPCAIVAIATTALVTWLASDDVATAIDLATLGVGTFLALGRVGCFRVGCCHGRRSRFGIVYREGNAAIGFPPRWIGLRVFPIQLVDGALSALLTTAGTAVWLGGAAPGTAASLYAAGYAAGRFALELARGDGARRAWRGLSEAQWTAAVTAAAAALWRPSPWTAAAAVGVGGAAALLLIARWRGWWPRLWLGTGHHLAEVAAAVGALARGVPGPMTTREGLRLSAAYLPDGRLDVVVSRPRRTLTPSLVAPLAAQLGRPWQSTEVVVGHQSGLVHILLQA